MSEDKKDDTFAGGVAVGLGAAFLALMMAGFGGCVAKTTIVRDCANAGVFMEGRNVYDCSPRKPS